MCLISSIPLENSFLQDEHFDFRPSRDRDDSVGVDANFSVGVDGEVNDDDGVDDTDVEGFRPGISAAVGSSGVTVSSDFE